MRPIKFRAWMRVEYNFDEKNKPYEMVYLDRKHDEVTWWVLNGKDGEPMDGDGGIITDFPWFLMQFTGLTDRNGKRIYEGDIVRMEQWQPSVMQVVFLEGAFCLANNDGKHLSDIHYANGECEVIGNVHENPELLDEVAQ